MLVRPVCAGTREPWPLQLSLPLPSYRGMLLHTKRTDFDASDTTKVGGRFERVIKEFLYFTSDHNFESYELHQSQNHSVLNFI